MKLQSFGSVAMVLNDVYTDLPIPKTWKSGDCEKKPRKIGRLGSQTGRFPKFA